MIVLMLALLALGVLGLGIAVFLALSLLFDSTNDEGTSNHA